ncbi:hypothetical protein KC19_3G105400 [Ceratodon purpureus]|uniref:Uncharacterized protein n=1 Tax=Ceratodon purpureus TaxID=3225 RepID=A0A8T0IKS9_CERPU|nr:hypothetical protein KC19_3G105400 [Ceratodon purpureus]
MATVCCGSLAPTKVVTQQPQSCAHSCSRGVQRALLPPCKLSGLAARRIGGRNEQQRMGRGDAFVVRMGIRAVESFDATFQLTAESDQLLRSMLVSESFLKQVAKDCSLGEDVKPEFSGEVFQPVPWSQTTKHGMLPEFEKYYHDKENYVIVNVPPQIMFKAKIFKPSRLCAIFKKVSSSS